jgi:hypothetical protein
MTFRHYKVGWLLVLLLVFSVSQFYAQPSLTTPEPAVQDVLTQTVPMIGRLEVHRGKHINVDNNDAESGHTILDGQTLETSDCTTASVHFLAVRVGADELGQVDLAADTKAVINYSAGRVKVTLERGCARVRVLPGIDGVIMTPDGKITSAIQPDTLGRRRAETCYPLNNNEDYEPDCIPPIVWIFGAGGAAGVVAAVVAPRGDNPSPPGPTVP